MKSAIMFDWWNTLWHPQKGIDLQINSFLKYLYEDDIFLGIIANNQQNSSKWIRNQLKENDLLYVFEFVISGGTIGIHKPNPYIFQIGMAFFPHKAESILMVGDSCLFDGASTEVDIDYFAVNLEEKLWVDDLKNYLYPPYL